MDKRKILAYVAGPYSPTEAQKKRGTVDYRAESDNICEAAGVAASLWEMGLAVICPHLNSSIPQSYVICPKFEPNQYGLSSNHVSAHVNPESYLAGDITMLTRCDILVLTPRWRESTGAVCEMERACGLRIPIFEYEHADSVRRIDSLCQMCKLNTLSSCLCCNVFATSINRVYRTTLPDVNAPDSSEIIAAVSELRDMLLRKNADYAGSWREPDCFGNSAEASLKTRISDKLARLKNLTVSTKNAVDESTRDTLLDLAGYFVLWCILQQKQHEWGLNNEFF